MTAISYGTDVAPHLRRILLYRRLRAQRWQVLHPEHCKHYDAADRSRWVRAGEFLNLLMEIAAVAAFVAGAVIHDSLNFGRRPGGQEFHAANAASRGKHPR